MHRLICSMFDRRRRALWRRQMMAAMLTAAMLLQSATAVAPAPGWWYTQAVLDSGTAANDYAAANVGQLKYLATKAAAAMNADLPGGAGTAINDLIDSWEVPAAGGVVRDDFQALNQGQLKNVAALFYDRLGLPYPWAGGAALRDDYLWVNAGQLKNVFAFELAFRSGGTLAEIPPLTLAAAQTAWEALPVALEGSTVDDFDGDGIPNLQEYLMGKPLFDPLDIDGDRIADLVEDLYPGILSKLRFADAVEDHDADGVMNFEEILLELDLSAASTTGRADGLTDAEVLAWGLCVPGVPLEPSTDAAAAAWEHIDAGWVYDHFGDESWLEETDANTDGEPDGLTAFRAAYGVEIFYAADSIGYPPSPYDMDGDSIDDYDHDWDGMSDLWEYRYEFSLRDWQNGSEDPDEDTLVNSYEFTSHTNPRLADSDGDGFDDADEIYQGSNPALQSSQPSILLTLVGGNGQDVSVNGQSLPLVVKVTQIGLPLQGVQVTFTVGSGTGLLKAGIAAGTTGTEVTVTTGSDGIATATYLAEALAGTSAVTATLSMDPTKQTSFALNVQALEGPGGSPGGPTGPWVGVPPTTPGTTPPAQPVPEPELLFHTSWLSVGGFAGWAYYPSGLHGRIGWSEPLRLASDQSIPWIDWTDGGVTWDLLDTSFDYLSNPWNHFNTAKSEAQNLLTNHSLPVIKNYYQPLPNAVPVPLWVDNWWAFYYSGPASYARSGEDVTWYDYNGLETEDAFSIEWIENKRWGGIQGERAQYRLHNNSPVPYEVRRTFLKLTHSCPITEDEGIDTRVWEGTPAEQEEIPGHQVTAEVVEFVIPPNQRDSVNGLKTPGGILDVTAPIVVDKCTWVQLWPVSIHVLNDPVCGDMIASVNKNSGVKHFVTPKKTTEIPANHVVLEAWGPTQAEMQAGLLEWHVNHPSYGQVDPADPTKFQVKRDSAKHAIVSLGRRGGSTATDSIKQDVWVVWCEPVTPTHGGEGLRDLVKKHVIAGTAEWDEVIGKKWDLAQPWKFKFEVRPKEIWQSAVTERPDLTGPKQKQPPGALPDPVTHKIKPYSTHPSWGAGDNATLKWDVSRQMKIRINNPDGISKQDLIDAFGSEPPLWFDNQPGDQTPVPFPTNAVEGNDDPAIDDEDANPYQAKSGDGLDHQEGELTAVDGPMFPVFNTWKKAGRSYATEAEFREFTRLELWDGSRPSGPFWFRISDYLDWHHYLRALYDGTASEWKNNNSKSGTGHSPP